ncbi:MAG TPA: hypothetical protein VK858_22075 [Longimicrobiales bacterium]|nr:hypothetical protein [Longimicrobiales bacterium]
MRLLVALLSLTAVVAAAGPYGATPEPVAYVSQNDFVIWFVEGTDTLGNPVSAETREVLHIRDAEGGLEVAVDQVDAEFSSSNVYGIDESGRVRSVDGQAVEDIATPRVDLLPRVPLDWADLQPGATWEDRVARSGEEPFGPTAYSAVRSYEVVGEVEAFGRRALLLVSSGRVELRQGGFQDAAQSVIWWQEVQGPVLDSVWFDVETRRLLANATHMDLSGTAGFEGGGESLTLPSGLRSSVRRVPGEG